MDKRGSGPQPCTLPTTEGMDAKIVAAKIGVSDRRELREQTSKAQPCRTLIRVDNILLPTVTDSDLPLVVNLHH
ncbi:hypothetical protein EDD30_4181 [Couchioplanes caeruleus]|uniref:Uncharacterized protein n=1 Tax=Couchioplanes caeruleus TaxID=56438 RepID=A0A3N1GMD3_9ACTN|nr:hypothetical protein EDD30_4181 [Couchioplanes caeruleus]